MPKATRFLGVGTTVFFASALVMGCATVSDYQPSSSMLLLKSQMNKKDAVSVFRDAMLLKPGEGLCDASFDLERDVPPSIGEDGYTLKAWRLGEKVSSSSSGTLATGMRMSSTYKKDFYVHTTRFSDITKVHIYRPIDSLRCGSSAFRFTTAGNLIVDVVGKESKDAIKIELKPSNLDRLLASMAVLAPQAKMTTGVGMTDK
jgi:hypothetical protein